MDAKDFLRLLNEENAAIATEESVKESKKPKPDLVRHQREEERREKWGSLRAREQPSKRPRQARNVVPHVDLS